MWWYCSMLEVGGGGGGDGSSVQGRAPGFKL